jgi:membrane-bound lytic murein transglycosylase D
MKGAAISNNVCLDKTDGIWMTMSTTLTPKLRRFLFATLVVAVICLLLSKPAAASDVFPVYDAMKPNVAFWKKIYTEYDTTNGVIHDTRDLTIIYDVIRLVRQDRRGARKINQSRVKGAKRKYKRILGQLARSGIPATPEQERVAALFGSKASQATFRRAMRNVRHQLGQKDRFRAGLIRSGAYLEEIQQIFRSAGLPEDLAYLPHVESSFNPKAYSKFGAAGMWQFTRSTGKRFMKVSYTIDERRDPLISSHAAAKLLKHNYRKLGSWPLALTAYNHGVAGVRRAKRSKGTYEEIFKGYHGRRFKFASRNFYSEFVAAREVAQDYRLYFGELRLDRPVPSRELRLDGYASLKKIARHLQVDIKVLRKLNPALRKPVYTGQKYIPKGYVIRLPIWIDQQVVVAGFPPEAYKSRQKRSRFYRVQRGDTAGKIARMPGVELADLMWVNNLNSRATIYVGQNLRLPTRDERAERLAMAELPKKETAEAPPVLTQTQPPPPEPPQLTPAVAEAEPAKPSFPVTEAEPTGPASPGTEAGPAKPSFPEAEAKPMPPEPSINPEVVTGNLLVREMTSPRGMQIGILRVEAEETLGHYADWLGIRTQEIRQLNGFRYGRAIRINQRVKIPLDTISKEQFEEKRFEYHKEIEEDFFGSYKIDEVQAYQVRYGDNIWSLCRETFEVPFWLVKKYNPNLDFNELRPAQQIMIPVVTQLEASPQNQDDPPPLSTALRSTNTLRHDH